MKLSKNGLIRINFRDSHPTENSRLKCNFKCSYCNQREIIEYPFDDKHLENTKNIWNKLEKIEDDILVRINFDGETFIDKVATDCAAYVSHVKNVKVCEVITNNSINPERYLDKFDISKLSFNLSYHPEGITMERFLENCKVLQSKNIPFFVNMVVTPQIMDEFANIVSTFKENNICFKPTLLLGPYEGKNYPDDYTEEHLSIIKNNYYTDLEFEYQNGKQSRDSLCYAGVDMFNLFIEGTVMRCFGSEIGKIDELIDGSIKLKDEPYPCPFYQCTCYAHMIGLKEFRDKFKLDDKFVDHYHEK